MISILIIFLSSTLDQIPTLFLIHNVAIMFPSYNLRNHVTEKVLLQKYGSFVRLSFEKEFHAARMKVSTFKKDDACQSYAFI